MGTAVGVQTGHLTHNRSVKASTAYRRLAAGVSDNRPHESQELQTRTSLVRLHKLEGFKSQLPFLLCDFE